MHFIVLFVFAIVFAGLFYFLNTQLAFDSPDFWIILAIACAVTLLVPASRMASQGRGRSKSAEVNPAKVVAFALICVAVLAFASLTLASMGMLRSGALHDLLGEEKSRDFKKTLPPLDLVNAPLVSYDMAERAAEKKLSEIPALGSQAKVGHLEKQLVNGKLYWIGFLQHRSFFTWFRRGATPGYVRVSATNPSDVELVTEIGGKKLTMTYLPSAYGFDSAMRSLRWNGYASAGLSEMSPEIDESGRPFLITTLFERKVGFGGKNAAGVVVLDVQTGQTQQYSVENAPKWIDRIQPYSFVKAQLADRLEYIHGWLNPSQTDRLSISGELDIIYGSDGRAHFFAGLGSKAREGGLVGFVLIDSRTKEVVRYNVAGVTEQVAQAAAEGVFPEKRYSATNALPFLVDGIPAYVMALRDGTGIPRAYGVVALTDFQKVAVADTLDSAVRLFQSKLNLDRTHTDSANRADEVTVTGKVRRISTEVRAGVSNYALMLEGQGSKLFVADVNRAEYLSVTQSGDMVQVRTLQVPASTVPILQFRNLELQGPANAAAPVAAPSPAAAPAQPVPVP